MPETEKNIVAGAGRAWPLSIWLPLIAVAVMLLCGCAVQGSRPSGQEPQAGPEGRTSDQATNHGGENAAQGDAELGHPALGDPGAPVLMVEYGDFQ